MECEGSYFYFKWKAKGPQHNQRDAFKKVSRSWKPAWGEWAVFPTWTDVKIVTGLLLSNNNLKIKILNKERVYEIDNEIFHQSQ